MERENQYTNSKSMVSRFKFFSENGGDGLKAYHWAVMKLPKLPILTRKNYQTRKARLASVFGFTENKNLNFEDSFSKISILTKFCKQLK
jgi:hypothetical protein